MPLHRRLTATAAITLAALLTGCGLTSGNNTGAITSSPATIKLTGTVFGGQQPVVGSTIQLYTVGTTGNASASTALIGTSVQTVAGGNFSITGLYSCTSATQVYITATGGNAGSGTNANLAMMTALGPCSGLTSSTFININELTTVAATFALAPFMTDATHVGATGSNPTGLVNAFNTAAALVNTGTGQLAATPAGVTLPATRLNTLADILAACVNTNGGGSTQCTALFSATGAADTITASLAIAKNPGAAANTALYSLASGTPPFVPTLSVQPNDFTLAINYTSSSLQSPGGIAIDANGNAWVTNQSGTSVARFPQPSTAFAATAFTGGNTILAPRGISVDRSGNVWIANTGGNNVVELASNGAVLSGTGFTIGGINAPVAIANDSANNAWIANFNGNSITEILANGTASSFSPITNAGISSPTAIAVDAGGKIAVANATSGNYCTISNAGVFGSCVGDGTLLGATSIATNGVTVAMTGSTSGATVNGAFSLGTTAGTVSGPYLGGGLTLPVAVAYDAAGKAWFANTASISAFAAAAPISPSTGYGSLSNPQGIAIDPSGNVWTANSGDNSVSIFVGLASPTTTPLAANVGP